MQDTKKFRALKSQQYCDNEDCSHYQLIGAGNIRTHSRLKGQVYCTLCKNRWVVTRGTIGFGLKTPVKKVINTLLMLANGTGLRKTCRLQGITPNTASIWKEKAKEHAEEFADYLKNKMHLSTTEIDTFWKYIQN